MNVLNIQKSMTDAMNKKEYFKSWTFFVTNGMASSPDGRCSFNIYQKSVYAFIDGDAVCEISDVTLYPDMMSVVEKLIDAFTLAEYKRNVERNLAADRETTVIEIEQAWSTASIKRITRFAITKVADKYKLSMTTKQDTTASVGCVPAIQAADFNFEFSDIYALHQFALILFKGKVANIGHTIHLDANSKIMLSNGMADNGLHVSVQGTDVMMILSDKHISDVFFEVLRYLNEEETTVIK